MKDSQKTTLRSFLGEPTAAKASGFAFSVAAILPSVLAVICLFVLSLFGATKAEGYDKQDWYLYLNYLFPQIAFLLIAFIISRYTGVAPKTAVASQRCAPKYFLLALLMQVGLFSLSELNSLFLEFLKQFGYQNPEIALPSTDGLGLLGVLFVVAVLPAVMEELFFRGVLLNGLSVFGKTGAVLLCGALFSLYHQNPAQTLYQFCCGVMYAWIALRAGSILPTIISHALNNALIIFLYAFEVTRLPQPFAIVSAVCLVASILWLLLSGKHIKADKHGVDAAEKKTFFVYAAVGIGVCVLSWLGVLLTGV